MHIVTRILKRIDSDMDVFRKPLQYSEKLPVCTCGECNLAVRENLENEVRLKFVYSKGSRNLASTQMRIPQSSGHIQALHKNISVTGICLSGREIRNIRNEVVILTKFASIEVEHNLVSDLIERNNRIYVDPIDGNIDVEKFSGIHGIIASSFSQLSHFKSISELDTTLIYHPPDFRLRELQVQNVGFGIAYFGSLARINPDYFSIDGLKIVVTPLSYKPGKQYPVFADEILKYPAHFVIGTSQAPGIHKPFTKGLIATSVGSISLISHLDTEGILMLGEDYPYIAKNLERSGIEEAIIHMKDTFKSTTWQRAENAHRNLLKFCCEFRSAMEWINLINGKDS